MLNFNASTIFTHRTLNKKAIGSFAGGDQHTPRFAPSPRRSSAACPGLDAAVPPTSAPWQEAPMVPNFAPAVHEGGGCSGSILAA
jgi:hypothetical protein